MVQSPAVYRKPFVTRHRGFALPERTAIPGRQVNPLFSQFTEVCHAN